MPAAQGSARTTLGPIGITFAFKGFIFAILKLKVAIGQHYGFL
jgi:hypothetical protein